MLLSALGPVSSIASPEPCRACPGPRSRAPAPSTVLLLLLSLSPLGLPLLGEGWGQDLWAPLGVGLAALGFALAWQEGWSLLLRVGLIGGLVALAGGAVGLSWLGWLAPPHAPAAAPSSPPGGLGPAEVDLMSAGWPALARADGFPRAQPLTSVDHQAAPPRHSLPALDSAKALPLVRRLPARLSFTVSTTAGIACATTLEGELICYSYPDFQERARCRLPGPAYRAVLAPDGKRLYAAISAPNQLSVSPVGALEWARGDLHAYDLTPLRAGLALPGGALRPTHSLALDATVRALLLSRDGSWLYHVVTGRPHVSLARLRASDLAPAGDLPLRPGAGAATLALADDGERLYLTRLNRLVVLDARSLRPLVSLGLPIAADTTAVGPRRLYVAENGTKQVVVVAPERGVALARWSVPLRGRLHLAATPDGRRLVVGNSTVGATRACLVACGGDDTARPELLATTGPGPRAWARGPSLVSPEGRFLLNQAGGVFALPAARGRR